MSQMKILAFLLIFIFFISSFSYAFLPSIHTRTEEEDPLRIDKKYDKLRGILLIGFSAYFFYMGSQMKKGAKYEKGDVELVGNLLFISSFPLFFWGITLTF